MIYLKKIKFKSGIPVGVYPDNHRGENDSEWVGMTISTVITDPDRGFPICFQVALCF